jgi:hypothetical protein
MAMAASILLGTSVRRRLRRDISRDSVERSGKTKIWA